MEDSIPFKLDRVGPDLRRERAEKHRVHRKLLTRQRRAENAAKGIIHVSFDMARVNIEFINLIRDANGFRNQSAALTRLIECAMGNDALKKELGVTP